MPSKFGSGYMSGYWPCHCLAFLDKKPCSTLSLPSLRRPGGQMGTCDIIAKGNQLP